MCCWELWAASLIEFNLFRWCAILRFTFPQKYESHRDHQDAALSWPLHFQRMCSSFACGRHRIHCPDVLVLLQGSCFLSHTAEAIFPRSERCRWSVNCHSGTGANVSRSTKHSGWEVSFFCARPGVIQRHVPKLRCQFSPVVCRGNHNFQMATSSPSSAFGDALAMFLANSTRLFAVAVYCHPEGWDSGYRRVR